MSVIPLPRTREQELQAQVDLLNEQLRITGAVYQMMRFHAFDSIKDDRCPCCGGRVRVNRTHNAVTLEAL